MQHDTLIFNIHLKIVLIFIAGTYMQMINALFKTQHKNNLKIIMALFRQKRRMQFLTSAPNIMGIS